MTDQLAPKPRRRGRPPTEPEWLKEVATLVGQGVPLRRALWRVGRHPLSERELKNIYRWKMFRRYYEEARIAYFREWGRSPGRHHTRYGERMLELLNAPGIGDLLKRS
jgi:hypothetical protein